MATKTRSKHQQGLYTTYKASNKQALNRKRKLTKLLKMFPNNEQIALALKNIQYRRKTPKTPQWSHTAKHYAKLFKDFSKGSDLKVGRLSEKAMFSLKMRAHTPEGIMCWNS